MSDINSEPESTNHVKKSTRSTRKRSWPGGQGSVDNKPNKKQRLEHKKPTKKQKINHPPCVQKYENFPFWWEIASQEEKERVNKILQPEPNSIVLSENFPCPECKAVTPHAYCYNPKNTWQIEWLGRGDIAPWERKDPLMGRIVECEVCNNSWLHHVEFKGFPKGPEEISRVLKN